MTDKYNKTTKEKRMKQKTSLLVLTLSTVLFAGCSNTATDAKPAEKPVAKAVVVKAPVAPVVNPLEARAKDAINEATTANKIAKRVGFDWNVTYKMLKKANKDLKAGKYQAAIDKATTAREYALIGLEQSETAKTAGPRLRK
jgi:uncharacterized lipoprotein YajG